MDFVGVHFVSIQTNILHLQMGIKCFADFILLSEQWKMWNNLGNEKKKTTYFTVLHQMNGN